MAKKENIPNDEVKNAAELDDAAVAQDAVANADLPQEGAAEAKPSVGQKIKDWFVSLWDKIKSAFVSERKNEQLVLPRELVDKIPPDMLLTDVQLTKKEKAARFFRSQSGWLFVLPAVLLMCIFTFYPIINAFVSAFKEGYNALNDSYTGWGFENFVRVIKGDTGTGGASFVQCLVNTLVFTLVSVPLSTLLALLISVALNSIKPLQKAYQTVLFLPYLTNSLAMGAVFATFFTVIGTRNNTDTIGIVNIILSKIGLVDPDNPLIWMDIGSPVWRIGDTLSIPWAKYIVVIIYEIWSGLPFKILILFSALQSVNKQYYDAAKIDGASKSTVLWKITAPLISPMISYLLVTGIMGGMKQYSAIVGLFGEQMGIDYDVGAMVGYIYRYIEDGYTGYAFAGSVLLFLIIMVITAINTAVSKKRVTY